MTNMTDNDPAALARRDDLVVQEMPEEVLVYDLRLHKAHCLNKSAAFIWNHCDGQTSVTALAGLLGREFGSPVDEQVVWYALDKLDQADLLETKPAIPAANGLSRRRMIKNLGVGAMVTIPSVISLLAPTVAQGQTVVTTSLRIATSQCTNQVQAVNCDDRCCTGAGDDRRTCVASLINPRDFSCSGTPCVSSGPVTPCIPRFQRTGPSRMGGDSSR